MKASESRIRNANLAVGLLACLTICGCSFSRDSLTDRPTQMEPRVSVDDLADENSGFEAVNPKSDQTFQPSESGTRRNSRDKLASWRDQREGDGSSIPLKRTDRSKTADVSGEKSDLAENGSLNRTSPFNQAGGGRRTSPRSKTVQADDDSATTTDPTPDDANPFD